MSDVLEFFLNKITFVYWNYIIECCR